jgi:hypothetical protein
VTDNIADIPEKLARNRGGRPVGSQSKPKLQALIDRLATTNKNEIKKIVEHTIKLAEAGEQWAVLAILDRAWVKPRTRAVTFELPPINTAADGEAALGAVLAACGAGKLTPDAVTVGHQVRPNLDRPHPLHNRYFQFVCNSHQIGPHRLWRDFYHRYPILQ